MNNIRNLTIKELSKYCLDNNEKEYKAKQLFSFLHKKQINNLDLMTNLSMTFREKLAKDFDFFEPTIEKIFVSKKDETKKFIIKLKDENIIESVLMKYDYGYSLCISSQVGCRMKCKFCASTINGLVRNLETYELLSQIYVVEKFLCIKIRNIVIMGSGEPFDNFDNIIKFLFIINDENGKNISYRKITISTCGIVEKINEFSKYNFPITLALSLHAVNDEIRKKIMPIAYKYKINDILLSMANYYRVTNRRVTLEYSLIDNINDSILDAKRFVNLLKTNFINKHIDFNVNLIPINEINENNFKRPNDNKVLKFKEFLSKNGINVTIRRELGSDISGSCGQLRNRFVKSI